MNVLILGAGGREHAIGWRILKDQRTDNLFFAPGNAGTLSCGENVELDTTDFKAVARFCQDMNVGLVVVGPEDPLVHGITDYLRAEVPGLLVLGPGSEGARLEGSKEFAKHFMLRHNIPTATHQSFKREELEQALAFIEMLEPPFVIKADGLAAGKGVIIADTRDNAEKALREMLGDGKFGTASDTVLIEEFLQGIEMSVFVVTDGSDYVFLPSAKDYKRIGEGDTGPNTGGMGTISPVPFADGAMMSRIEDRIVRPTIEGLKEEGIDYRGFIFFGLMISDKDPYVIEYNVRLGDPEAESILPRTGGDFFELLKSAARGSIDPSAVHIRDEWSVTVMLVSGGYPGSYQKEKLISGLAAEHENIRIFHAGTRAGDEMTLTSGGRVLGVNASGKTMEDALSSAYQRIRDISFEKMDYRKDIGQDLKPYITSD